MSSASPQKPAASLTKLKVAVTLLLMVSAAAGGVIALVPESQLEARPQASAPPAAQAAISRDKANDTLPAGALMRLGTTRWRLPAEHREP